MPPQARPTKDGSYRIKLATGELFVELADNGAFVLRQLDKDNRRQIVSKMISLGARKCTIICYYSGHLPSSKANGILGVHSTTPHSR